MNEPNAELPEMSQIVQLINRLTPERRLHFHKALVQQTIDYVTQKLPPETHDDGHRQGCDNARRWLECPTEELAKDLCAWAGGECWDGGVRYSDYPEYFLTPISVIGVGTMDLVAAVRLVVRAVPESERAAAVDWQIAMVQSILEQDSL